MPSSLYQKYRPQTWGDVVDQSHVKVTLEHEIIRGQIAHAYLFVGPRGVGKTTIARVFAKAVNCLKKKDNSAEPCNKCDSCSRINKHQSFDIIEIDAASNTGVDHVREHILGAAEVTAGHGEYRVFIIDEVHMLSAAAFNAMLKMLEEPPEHVIFILATTEVHKVPATIISRCQRFNFKKIPIEAIRERIRMLCGQEEVTVDEDVLRAIATHAEGSLRDAESILGQVMSLGGKHLTMAETSLVIPRSNLGDAAELTQKLIRKVAGEAIEFINERVESGVSVPVFMADIISWLRSLLLAKVGHKLDLFSKEVLGELQTELNKQVTEINVTELQNMMDIFICRRKLLADTPIPQLPLELAIVEICGDNKGSLRSGQDIQGHPEKIDRRQTQGDDARPLSEKKETLQRVQNDDDVAPSKDKRRGASKFTLEEVKNRWQEVLDHVKGLNRSLSYVLATTSLRGVNEGKIELGVEYSFHRDRLHDEKNQSVLNKATEEVFGQSIVVEAILNKEG